MSWTFFYGVKRQAMFSNNKCRHKFEPRYTSGLTDSEVLSRMASTLLSSDCTEMVWHQFNKTVTEYRKAKVYVGDVCRKCGVSGKAARRDENTNQTPS